ncbi:MAG TPA: hypothetical protein VMF14_01135, partial [Solirubrobacteraceae bacterium]|nr:hypothetical protein [Solirubrobacteraceae bacterium]
MSRGTLRRLVLATGVAAVTIVHLAGVGRSATARRAQARAAVSTVQTLPGTHCSVFPADNPWNQRVD